MKQIPSLPANEETGGLFKSISNFLRKSAGVFSAENLPYVFGAVFAFLVMFLHPLIYDNYFFNINRYKFKMLCIGGIASLIISLILHLNRLRKRETSAKASLSAFAADLGVIVFLITAVIFCFTADNIQLSLVFSAVSGVAVYLLFALRRSGKLHTEPAHFSLPDLAILFFVLSAFLSCLMSGTAQTSFMGDNGRKNGLLLILIMGAFHVIVSGSKSARKLAIWGILIGGVICAYIGVLNFFKIDPLGFYGKSLSEKDHRRFISTIGNIDFFSAYLCLFLPAVTALFVSGKHPVRYICLPAVAVGTAALMAARADGTVLCFGGTIFFTLYLGMKNKKSMISCLIALGTMFSALSAVGFISMARPEGHFPLAGSVMGLFAGYPLPMFAFSLFLFAGAVMLFLFVPEKKLSRHERIRKLIVLVFFLILALAAAGIFCYYTFINTEAELSGSMKLFRFEDTWGTHRGGVWVRCLKLYSESDLRVKLLGFGPDELKKPLADAYGKEIAAYSGYSFDNAHNEFIQYLLTLGALGLAFYLVFLISTLYTLARAMKHCPYAAAAFAAAATYLLHSVVTVNQPITTPLLFLLLSCGASAAKKHVSLFAANTPTGDKHENAETGKTASSAPCTEG